MRSPTISHRQPRKRWRFRLISRPGFGWGRLAISPGFSTSAAAKRSKRSFIPRASSGLKHHCSSRWRPTRPTSWDRSMSARSRGNCRCGALSSCRAMPPITRAPAAAWSKPIRPFRSATAIPPGITAHPRWLPRRSGSPMRRSRMSISSVCASPPSTASACAARCISSPWSRTPCSAGRRAIRPAGR